MSIQQQILLRYRSDGHLRFGYPPNLLSSEHVDILFQVLERHHGIYRVRINNRQGKLSIRYFEEMTDLTRIARVLADAFAQIEFSRSNSEQASANKLVASDQTSTGHWLNNAVQETQETLTAARIVLERILGRNDGIRKESSKLATEFLTDVLVLWIIKSHWHLIIEHWLKRPWSFRYEWSASIYLIFLLVRSKKTRA